MSKHLWEDDVQTITADDASEGLSPLPALILETHRSASILSVGQSRCVSEDDTRIPGRSESAHQELPESSPKPKLVEAWTTSFEDDPDDESPAPLRLTTETKPNLGGIRKAVPSHGSASGTPNRSVSGTSYTPIVSSQTTSGTSYTPVIVQSSPTPSPSPSMISYSTQGTSIHGPSKSNSMVALLHKSHRNGDGRNLRRLSFSSHIESSVSLAETLKEAGVGKKKSKLGQLKSLTAVRRRASTESRTTLTSVDPGLGKVKPERRSNLTLASEARARSSAVSDIGEEGEEDFGDKTRCERILHFLRISRENLQPYCRVIVKAKWFQLVMFLALLAALFLPDFWVVIDRPNNHDLDVFLTLVLFLFLFEIFVQAIALTRTYWGSFFFWTDLVGAFSLLLDLSYIGLMSLWSGGDGAVSDNVILMRAARIAKLGARAGRFTKLVKLLRFLPGMHSQMDEVHTAKVISNRLVTALSTRISCLIIIMVMILPIFSLWSFPDQDWSPHTWMDILEDAGSKSPQLFQVWLGQCLSFYEARRYSPYKLVATFPNATGTWEFSSPHGAPIRSTNSVKYESNNLKVEFNFTTPNRIDALMSMGLILSIMLLMIIFSLMLTCKVSQLVVVPLEKILQKVKICSSKIFDSVTDMTHNIGDEEEDEAKKAREDESDDDDEAGGFDNETALLAKVIDKLGVLGHLFVKKGLDEEELKDLDEADHAVFIQYQGVSNQMHKAESREDDHTDGLNLDDSLKAETTMIETAGLSLDLLNSWNLNPLELDSARCHAAAMFFAGRHMHATQFDMVSMGNFLHAAEAGYNALSYHSWFHAIDVTHCVYRFLKSWRAEVYMSGLERYALLVSAICHDVGHEGFSNPFLVEIAHELALRYNDKSPLENMHCATLFAIAGQTRCNIFTDLTKKDYQEFRRIAAEAILNTDAARHFEMVKDLQVLYEMNSEIFQAGMEKFAQDTYSFPTEETAEVLRQADTRSLLRKTLLHTADISNPMKPFRICQVWARKICEEFFTQGDREKELGLAVGPLNDREKSNRPTGQVGFIEFLVAPLAIAVMKVLTPFESCVEMMVNNAKRWQQEWIQTTKPEPSKDDQKALADRIAKLERKFLDTTEGAR